MTAGVGIGGVLQDARRADYAPDLSYHGDERPAPGDASLVLTVGGVAVRLDGLTTDQRTALSRRHGVFAGPPGEASDLAVAVRCAGRDGFLRLPAGPEPENYRVHLAREGGAVLASSYEWAGWFRGSTGQGSLALTAEALADPAVFDRSLENFLRVVFAHVILSRGGFLLHSAGLVREGRAYLFFGPSGAGKTTVTSLTPEALILSDDLTMVVAGGPDGAHGACSVPFRGLFAPMPASARTYPIAGFFRLVQDRSDFLEPLGGAAAVGEVAASLPFVMETPETAGAAIDAVASAARRTPVWRLHFRKDRTFWDVIGRAERDGGPAPGGGS